MTCRNGISPRRRGTRARGLRPAAGRTRGSSRDRPGDHRSPGQVDARLRLHSGTPGRPLNPQLHRRNGRGMVIGAPPERAVGAEIETVRKVFTRG